MRRVRNLVLGVLLVMGAGLPTLPPAYGFGLGHVFHVFTRPMHLFGQVFHAMTGLAGKAFVGQMKLGGRMVNVMIDLTKIAVKPATRLAVPPLDLLSDGYGRLREIDMRIRRELLRQHMKFLDKIGVLDIALMYGFDGYRLLADNLPLGHLTDEALEAFFRVVLTDRGLTRDLVRLADGHEGLVRIMNRIGRGDRGVRHRLADLMADDPAMANAVLDLALHHHKSIAHMFIENMDDASFAALTQAMMKDHDVADKGLELLLDDTRDHDGATSPGGPVVNTMRRLGSPDDFNDGNELALERMVYATFSSLDAAHDFLNIMEWHRVHPEAAPRLPRNCRYPDGKTRPLTVGQYLMDFIFLGEVHPPQANGQYSCQGQTRYRKQSFLNVYAALDGLEQGLLAGHGGHDVFDPQQTVNFFVPGDRPDPRTRKWRGDETYSVRFPHSCANEVMEGGTETGVGFRPVYGRVHFWCNEANVLLARMLPMLIALDPKTLQPMRYAVTFTDRDGDGIPDRIHLDFDQDGVAELHFPLADVNGDGILDLQMDLDGDGRPDVLLGLKDLDGDGIPEIDMDTDGDGRPDLQAPLLDLDGDGVRELPYGMTPYARHMAEVALTGVMRFAHAGSNWFLGFLRGLLPKVPGMFGGLAATQATLQGAAPNSPAVARAQQQGREIGAALVAVMSGQMASLRPDPTAPAPRDPRVLVPVHGNLARLVFPAGGFADPVRYVDAGGALGFVDQPVYAAGSDDRWLSMPRWIAHAQWYRTDNADRTLPQDQLFATLELAPDREHLVFLVWPQDLPYPTWAVQQGFLPITGQEFETTEQTGLMLFGRILPPGTSRLDLMGPGGSRASHNYLLAVMENPREAAYVHARALLADAARHSRANWLVTHVVAPDSTAHGAPAGYTEIGYLDSNGTAVDAAGIATGAILSLALRDDVRKTHGDIVRLVTVPDYRKRAAAAPGTLTQVEHAGARVAVDTLSDYTSIGFFTQNGAGTADSFSLGAGGGPRPGITTVLVKKGYEDYVRLLTQGEGVEAVQAEPGFRIVGYWHVGGISGDSHGRLIDHGILSLQIRTLDSLAGVPRDKAYDAGLRLTTYFIPAHQHPIDESGMKALLERVAADPDNFYGHAVLGGAIDYGHANPFGPNTAYLTRLTGQLEITQAGTYRFAVDGDDAVELRIDGKVVTGWYGGHAALGNAPGTDYGAHAQDVYLDAGLHTLEFLHEQGTGSAAFGLYWMPPGATAWRPVPAGVLSHGRYDSDFDGIPDGDDQACPNTPPGDPVGRNGCSIPIYLMSTHSSNPLIVQTYAAGEYQGKSLYEGGTDTWTEMPDWLSSAIWYRPNVADAGFPSASVWATLELDPAREHLVFIAWPSDRLPESWLWAQGYVMMTRQDSLPGSTRVLTSAKQGNLILFGKRVPAGTTSIDFYGTGGGSHPYLIAYLTSDGSPLYAQASALLSEAEQLARVKWLEVVPGALSATPSVVPAGYVGLGDLSSADGVVTDWSRTGRLAFVADAAHADVVKFVNVSQHRGDPAVGLRHDGARIAVDSVPGYSLVGYVEGSGAQQDAYGNATQTKLNVLVKEGYEDVVKLKAAGGTQQRLVPLPGYRIVGFWKVSYRSLDSFGTLVEPGGWISLQVKALPASPVVAADAYDPGLRYASWWIDWSRVKTPYSDGGMADLVTAVASDTDALYGIHVLDGIHSYNQLQNPMAHYRGSWDDQLDRMVGRLRIDQAGWYRFALDGDDEVELRLDGRVVSGWYGGHAWNGDGLPRVSGPDTRRWVYLEAGYHSIEFLHVEHGGDSGFALYWQRPGETAWSLVPSSRFDHGRYDEDLDGIADAADACPHTPIGLPV
ncbi:MAG: hypothetical protein D6721_04640, partial [Gammaproteobacteria bacterium]